jgi:hypothetical protein
MKMMTEKLANEIGGALQKIEELTAKTIVEKSDEAERLGNEQFLQRVLREHAFELLSCWFTMTKQYKPLIQGFASLLLHANSAIDRAEPKEPKAE